MTTYNKEPVMYEFNNYCIIEQATNTESQEQNIPHVHFNCKR